MNVKPRPGKLHGKTRPIMRGCIAAVALLAALTGLLRGADPEAPEDRLLTDLKSPLLSTRLAAIVRVEQLETIPANFIPVLLQISQGDLDKSDKRAAVESFMLLHKATLILARTGEAAIPGLRVLMKKEETRWKAVEVLQRMGEAALPALPELITALDDKNPHVRYFAAKAMMQLGPKAAEAVPALTRHVDDREESPRQFSIQALGAIGEAAKPALPALEKAMKHEDLLTEIYAKEAIEKIKRAEP